MVMWRQPEIRAPFSGFLPLYSARNAIRPGISVSAMVISLRPHSARLISLTLKSVDFSTVDRVMAQLQKVYASTVRDHLRKASLGTEKALINARHNASNALYALE